MNSATGTTAVDYAELDAAIIDAVRNNQLPQWTPPVIQIVFELSPPDMQEWRLVPRRMQALKRAGKIVYSKDRHQTALSMRFSRDSGVNWCSTR